MEKKKYEYCVISPDHNPPVMDSPVDDSGEPKLGRTLGQTYSCDTLFPNCDVNVSLSWFYDVPNKNPYIEEHVHDVDELLLFLPSFNDRDDDTEAVWGEADVYIDGECYTITKNTCILCPAGVKHCPIVYKRVDRPHCFMTILMSSKYTKEQAGKIIESVGGKFVVVGDAKPKD